LTTAEAVEGLQKVVALGHMADFLGTPAILRKKGGGTFPATRSEPPQIKADPIEVMQGGTAFHDPHRRKRRK
jgi:hypothetical protein